MLTSPAFQHCLCCGSRTRVLKQAPQGAASWPLCSRQGSPIPKPYAKLKEDKTFVVIVEINEHNSNQLWRESATLMWSWSGLMESSSSVFDCLLVMMLWNGPNTGTTAKGLQLNNYTWTFSFHHRNKILKSGDTTQDRVLFEHLWGPRFKHTHMHTRTHAHTHLLPSNLNMYFTSDPYSYGLLLSPHFTL